MKINSRTVKIVVITAFISCLITSIVKDIIYFYSSGAILNKVSQVSNLIRRNYLFDYDEDKMAEYAASALAFSVGDDYTVYYPKDDFNDYKDLLTNSFVGVGIELGIDIDHDKLLVIAPIEGSPAANAGILANDYIIKVDNISYSGGELSQAVHAIRGEENTNVKLTIERNGEILDFVITRQVIKNSSVTFRMLDDEICYVRITEFSSAGEYNKKSAYEDFMKAVKFLKENDAKKLVLDLRNNPGGSLNVVIRIADELLPEGIITYTETREGKRREFFSKDGGLDIPIALLVNSSSASASEVLTGALKDHNRATVIGTKTFGKGIVQTLFPFSDGSGLSITTAKYYTPNGICIHGIGIEPDVVVEMETDKQISNLTYDEDIQLKKAVEILK